MGHPLVLDAIEKLLGTANFIPTWDSFVFKVLHRLTSIFSHNQQPGRGVPIKWHRDASAASVDNTPAIDVGFYLDAATVELQNCLWVIPGTTSGNVKEQESIENLSELFSFLGSNKWDDNFAAHMITFLSQDGRMLGHFVVSRDRFQEVRCCANCGGAGRCHLPQHSRDTWLDALGRTAETNCLLRIPRN